MSASTSPFADQCAVCNQPGRLKCGACRAVKFCSQRCQSLLWPTHKALCGRRLDTFFVPPMSPEEVKQLEQVKDAPGGSSFLTRLNVTWTHFADKLRSDAVPEPFGELLRCDAILTARRVVSEAADQDAARVDPPPSPWSIFAPSCHEWLGDHAYVVHDRPDDISETALLIVATTRTGRSPFTVLNAILRQELVAATIRYQVIRATPQLEEAEALALLRLSDRRVADELRRVDVSDEHRARIEARWRCRTPDDID
ncbi:hypothetical protein JCM9279_007049 [Rhodotorula babjevae]